jgi:DNA-binding MarR family transcriptional regulator
VAPRVPQWTLRLREQTPITLGELSSRLHLPEDLLGPHIDRLVGQGDVIRSDDRVVLTEAGGRAAERLSESRSS